MLAVISGVCLLRGGILYGGTLKRCLWEETLRKIQESTYQTYFPVFSFVEENAGRAGDAGMLSLFFADVFPLYAYAEQHTPLLIRKGEGSLMQEITASSESLIEAVKKENENADFSASAQEEEAGKEREEERKDEIEKDGTENGIEKETENGTDRSKKQRVIDRESLSFETLISDYYAVDGTTYIDRSQLNAAKLAGMDMTLKQDASKPQILIYHTHSQEAFADSVPGDEETTIVGAGEYLAELLSEKYGFHVIHHTGKYDAPSRDYAYSNAAPALEQILSENPSIEVIIDLHRDQMPEETRLIWDADGKKTARFMFFNGLSRTNKTGEIDYLKNPNLDANLAFSFQMQMAAGEYYPGITRKVYLKGYRYNMQYREKTLLIELGAQNNTVEEIKNACEPLAHILWLVLSGEA